MLLCLYHVWSYLKVFGVAGFVIWCLFDAHEIHVVTNIVNTQNARDISPWITIVWNRPEFEEWAWNLLGTMYWFEFGIFVWYFIKPQRVNNSWHWQIMVCQKNSLWNKHIKTDENMLNLIHTNTRECCSEILGTSMRNSVKEKQRRGQIKELKMADDRDSDNELVVGSLFDDSASDSEDNSEGSSSSDDVQRMVQGPPTPPSPPPSPPPFLAQPQQLMSDPR